MATFTYTARTGDGDRVRGTLTSASRQAALAELASRRLAPVDVHEVHERASFRRAVSNRQLATAYRQLSDLLRAGVPLLRGLRLLGRSKAQPRLATVMREIAEDVAQGSGLGDAIGKHEDVFPGIHVAMIRAGERGGFLESVLGRMGQFIEHQADLRGKVVGNLVYPFALLLVGAGVVIFALVFLVPKFENFYARIELPLPTKIILGTSRLVTGSWPILLGVFMVLVAVAWWASRRPDVQRAAARVQLHVPKLGALARDLAVGRFTRILGTLLENGIPMLPAMQISRDATGHILLVEAIDDAIDAVRAGETLAEPLAASGMLAEDMVEMISVGESANNLPSVLITMAETIEKRADRLLSAFVRLMEPVLLLAMAAMVLFIFMALVVPMLRMSSSLG